MMKTFKIILIASIFLPFTLVQAQVGNLVVQFEQTPLFNEANFLPGEGVSRWVKVTNNSGQTQRIATEAINKSDPNRLGDVLNLEIKEGGVTRYNNALSKFFAEGEVFLSELAGSEVQTQYDFIVSFYSGAQNPFQGKSVGFDILVGFQGTEGGLLPGAGGGGGGFLPPGLTIYNQATTLVTGTSVTITWTTSYAATSQVIYAKDGESHTLCLTQTEGCALGTPPPPKYGYERTTPKTDIFLKVLDHSVTIDGLTSGTTYYYRAVSHGSLAISTERSFTTLTPEEAEARKEQIVVQSEGGVNAGEIVEEIKEIKETEETEEENVQKTETETAGETVGMVAAVGMFFKDFKNIFFILLLAVIVLLILRRKRRKKEE